MPSLTREEWAEVEAAYQSVREACGESVAERRLVLQGLPSRLRCEVEALLRLGDSATQFLRGDALGLMERARRHAGADADGAENDTLPDGAFIGPYRLRRELGRGGMGSVHLAERSLAGVVQLVALKRIDRFRVRHQLVARFEEEQRVLASLDHPGIARLLDVGVDDRVGPYLVMEFVDGTRIDDWCDERRLDIHARVELLAQVCDAVHAVHQRLVAHRDLKPANVLVTHEGVAKLVDFGIAGLISQELGRGEPSTALTPAYASPEQRAGSAQSTASDIYALGVIAHELLAGCLPSTVREATGGAMSDTATAHAGPSLVASWRSMTAERQTTIAARRSCTPRRLTRLLSGDLDAIVRRATAFDARDRYATAASLGEDLRRSLRHEVIEAGASSSAIRLRKFVRRHRAASVAGAAACVALLAAGAIAIAAAVHSRRAELEVRDALARAETEGSVAKAFNDFVIRMLTAPSPMLPQTSSRSPGDARLSDLLGDAVAALPTLRDRPEVESRVTAFLAMTHAHMGDPAAAASLYQRALALQSAARGTHDNEALSMRDSLGSVLLALDRLDEAQSHLETVLAARMSSIGPDDPLTLATRNNLAQVLARRGRNAEALRLLEEVVARRRAHGTLRTRDGLASLDNLALALIAAGRAADALPPQNEALEGLRTLLGADHPDAIEALGNRAFLLFSLGDIAAAALLFDEVVERWSSLTSPTDPRAVGQRINLASCYDRLGRLDEALTHFDFAIAALPDDGRLDPATRARALTNRAAALRRAGRLAESAAGFEASIAFQKAHLPSNASSAANARAGLGGVLLELGRVDEAIPQLTHASEAFSSMHGDQHPRTRALIAELADALDRAGRANESQAIRSRLVDPPVDPPVDKAKSPRPGSM